MAQSISYEVRIMLTILRVVFLTGRYHFLDFGFMQSGMNYFIVAILIFFLILVTFVAETNRSPFDFAEGESELVSGFNIEYGSGGFALLFLAEYSRIIFIGIIRVILLFSFKSLVFYYLVGSFLSFRVIWLRGSFPSYRYDMLIGLA